MTVKFDYKALSGTLDARKADRMHIVLHSDQISVRDSGCQVYDKVT